MATQRTGADSGAADYRSWFGAVASVLGGRSLAAAAAFLSNFLVLLELGPAVFGAFYTLFALMSLVAGLTGPAIDTSLVRFAARHKDEPGDGSLPFFKLVFLVKCGIWALTMIVAVAAARPVLGAFFGDAGREALGPWAVVLAFFGGASVSMWGFAQSYFLAHERFHRYAGYEFFSSLLRLGLVMLLMGFETANPVIYLAAYVAAPLVMGLISWSELPRSVFAAAATRNTARRFFAFGRWVILASVFTTLAQRLDILMLGYFQRPEYEIGLYSAAVAIVLAGELVLLTFHSVLLPKASAIRDPGFLRLFIGRFRIPSMLFSLVLVFMVPVVDAITRLPAPAAPGTWQAWYEAIPTAASYYGASGYFTILLMGVLVTIACSPAVTALYGLGHSGVICAFEGARLALTLLLGALLIPRYGALGMAWAVAGVRSAVSIIAYLVSHQWVKRVMLRAYAARQAAAS